MSASAVLDAPGARPVPAQDHCYTIPSASRPGRAYTVCLAGTDAICSCPQGRDGRCAHAYRARALDAAARGTPLVRDHWCLQCGFGPLTATEPCPGCPTRNQAEWDALVAALYG